MRRFVCVRAVNIQSEVNLRPRNPDGVHGPPVSRASGCAYLYQLNLIHQAEYIRLSMQDGDGSKGTNAPVTASAVAGRTRQSGGGEGAATWSLSCASSRAPCSWFAATMPCTCPPPPTPQPPTPLLRSAESEFLDGDIVFATPFSIQLTTSNLGSEANVPVHMRGLGESAQVHTEVKACCAAIRWQGGSGAC